IYISHRIRAVIIIAVVIGLLFLFQSLPTIVSIVLLGSTLALVLSFPIRFLQRFISRRLSILIVTITSVGTTVLLVSLAIPFLLDEISRFAESLPEISTVVMDRANNWLGQLYDRGWIDQEPDALLKDVQNTLLSSTQTLFGTILDNVINA